MRSCWIALAGFLIASCPLGSVGAEPPNADPFPTPASKKGLQVQMVDDALALGIQHAAINVNLTRLVEPAAEVTDSAPQITLGDKTFLFSSAAVAGLDAQVKPLSDKGVLVYLILLPYASQDAARDKLMLHANYAKGRRNTGPIGMFNTQSAEGRAWLSAAIEFLAERYGGSHPERGRVWGYIAGNEVNSHWFWANMGRASLGEVVTAYERGVRLIHTAVRKHSTQSRVYISLEHCWGTRYAGGDARQCVPGREFLTAFAAAARAGGDFDWHLAYHPYPEPLTDCRFWLDRKHSTHKPAAPVVSFRNLDVLEQALSREPLLWQGAPRRVILSEQGFHCADGPEGEQNQAVAYALAWKAVAALPGIDAFILHRHVDHAHEGGLKLGLWTNQPGSIATPDRKRLMYNVFLAAGTDNEDQAFSFALPILNAPSWDAALRNLRDD